VICRPIAAKKKIGGGKKFNDVVKMKCWENYLIVE